MGRLTRLRLPRLGETMEEARIVDWLKAEGDAFRRGEVLLEVETDKTVVEVPALEDGVLVRHLVRSGDNVSLDAEIAEVEVEGEGEVESESEAEPAIADAPAPVEAARPAPGPVATVPAAPATSGEGRVPASPAARKLAQRNGLDLSAIAGSGPRGRVQGADVATALAHAGSGEGVSHVETAAGAVAYRRSGSGAVTAVFLHGLFADSAAWRNLPAKVAAQGMTALALDLPGHGASTAGPGDLDAVTQCLAEALDRLVPRGACVLVGHSVGAIFAARLALRLGARAAGLILSAPAGIGLRIDAGFVAAMLGAQTPEILRRALAMLGPEAGPVSAAALQSELDRLRAARPGHARIAALAASEGVQTSDIRDVLARCAPVPHVVVGMRDRVLDWQDATRLPPRVGVHFCEEAGHMPHLAVPGLMQELIAAALR